MVTAADFKRAVAEGVAWLRKTVAPGTRYALNVEAGDPDPRGTEWLASQVVRALGKPVRFDAKSAIEHGARTVVFFDDAVYSGSQMYHELGDLRRYAARRGLRGLRVVVCVAYATSRGMEVIEDAANDLRTAGHAVDVFAARPLRQAANVLSPAALGEIQGAYGFLAPTLTIMPHKIPDEMSFGFGNDEPTSLGRHLERRLAPAGSERWTAPYKRADLLPPPRVFYRTKVVDGEPARVQYALREWYDVDRGRVLHVLEARVYDRAARKWVSTPGTRLLDGVRVRGPARVRAP